MCIPLQSSSKHFTSPPIVLYSSPVDQASILLPGASTLLKAFAYYILVQHSTMTPVLRAFLLGTASLVAARPAIEARTVTSLDQAAVAEAQPRDDTATRAFSGVPIKV